MGKRTVQAVIRPMTEADVSESLRIMRLAFGTFVGLPEPETFAGDMDFVGQRWRSHPEGAFVAEVDGALIGSNFAMRWGSFGYFGPLSVHPDYWDAGIGQQLMKPIMDRFAAWGVTLSGLFTFPNSPKHIGLYQRFGFRPRSLTAIMTGPANRGAAPVLYSSVSAAERSDILAQCAALTGSLYPGLDLSREIEAVAQHGLGDTVIVVDGSRVTGFAVCHVGPGTEAGGGGCYAKFAAAESPAAFDSLLTGCETFAAASGAERLTAGVNTARTAAYEALMKRGYRAEYFGIAMHAPNDPGFSRPEAFVLDDWR